MEMMKGLNLKGSTLNEGQLEELISGQLRYKGKTIEEISKNPSWRTQNRLTLSEYREWCSWAVDLLTTKHFLDEKEAHVELSWMELKFGLNVNYGN